LYRVGQFCKSIYTVERKERENGKQDRTTPRSCRYSNLGTKKHGGHSLLAIVGFTQGVAGKETSEYKGGEVGSSET